MDEFTRRISLQTFEKNLNYKFNNIQLLNVALTHASFSHEQKLNYDYERMEVLGDSLLGFIITDYLYKTYHNINEGEISRIKSFVVSEPSLARASERVNIPEFIQFGRGEEQNGGRRKPSILADVFESVVCAIYLDSHDIECPYDFVIHCLNPEIIKSTGQDQQTQNFKSLLQEYAMKTYGIKPEYKLLKTLGPEHDKTFVISVELNEVVMGMGTARSRKEGEQMAAQNAYNFIMEILKTAPVEQQ